MNLRLYSYWRSSCSWRVRLGLGLKGLAAEYVAVDLLAGQQDAPDHLARNPMRQVPVLELLEGGQVALRLVQSVAILEWLEEVHPAPPLLPRDPAGRARVRALVEHVNSSIQPYQNAAPLKWLRERFPGAEKDWVRHWLQRGLTGLEASVAEGAGRFCHGDQPTLADCYLVPQLHGARRFEVDLAPFPTLRRIEVACEELPAFQAAHPDRQPDAPPAAARTP
jgi:maleylpyruvate isomerase